MVTASWTSTLDWETPAGRVLKAFAESIAEDRTTNCRRLWPLLYGRAIDPRGEIVAPALAKRRKGYGEPSSDYRQELKEAADEVAGS